MMIPSLRGSGKAIWLGLRIGWLRGGSCLKRLVRARGRRCGLLASSGRRVGLPGLGFRVGADTAALIGMTINLAAYSTEIIRAGIQSIRRPQVHAGLALGLTPWQTMKSIVLPQAFRNMVPVLLTQAIVLFQDTSLVYVVGLKDFLTAADLVAVRDNRVVELYMTAAVVYFVLCLLGSLWVRRLKRQYAI